MEQDHPYFKVLAQVELLNNSGLHSVQVYKRGKYWSYFREESFSEKLEPIYSITKSILSLGILKILEQEGLHILEQPALTKFYSEYDLPWSSRKKSWTVLNLLNQSSGLKWREIGIPWNEQNSLQQMERSSNWIEYVLRQDCVADAGRHFTYSSGVSHILSKWIQLNTNESTESFIQSQVLHSLGIDQYLWVRDPQGLVAGGKGLEIHPKQLFNAGIRLLEWRKLLEWNFKYKISAIRSMGDYGLHWWCGKNDAIMALGYGGNMLYLDFKKELVICVLAQLPKSDFLKPISFAESIRY